MHKNQSNNKTPDSLRDSIIYEDGILNSTDYSPPNDQTHSHHHENNMLHFFKTTSDRGYDIYNWKRALKKYHDRKHLENQDHARKSRVVVDQLYGRRMTEAERIYDVYYGKSSELAQKKEQNAETYGVLLGQTSKVDPELTDSNRVANNELETVKKQYAAAKKRFAKEEEDIEAAEKEDNDIKHGANRYALSSSSRMKADYAKKRQIIVGSLKQQRKNPSRPASAPVRARASYIRRNLVTSNRYNGISPIVNSNNRLGSQFVDSNNLFDWKSELKRALLKPNFEHMKEILFKSNLKRESILFAELSEFIIQLIPGSALIMLLLFDYVKPGTVSDAERKRFMNELKAKKVVIGSELLNQIKKKLVEKQKKKNWTEDLVDKEQELEQKKSEYEDVLQIFGENLDQDLKKKKRIDESEKFVVDNTGFTRTAGGFMASSPRKQSTTNPMKTVVAWQWEDSEKSNVFHSFPQELSAQIETVFRNRFSNCKNTNFDRRESAFESLRTDPHHEKTVSLGNKQTGLFDVNFDFAHMTFRVLKNNRTRRCRRGHLTKKVSKKTGQVIDDDDYNSKISEISAYIVLKQIFKCAKRTDASRKIN